MIKRREERLDLALALLLIAREEYPRLAIEDYVERLDQLAAELRIEIDVEADGASVARWLGEFLAGQQEFGGNKEDYYDPRNSYLNQVIDRRLGIPITLSVVYLEVGREPSAGRNEPQRRSARLPFS